MHCFTLTTSSRFASSKLLSLDRRASKHGRARTFSRLLRGCAHFLKCTTIASRIVLHLLHLLAHSCVFVSLEISTRHADFWIIGSPSIHPFFSKFFLDAFSLFFSFCLSNFLLAFEDAFISGIHLKICFKLRHLNRLTISKSDHIVERKNEVKCFFKNYLFINIYGTCQLLILTYSDCSVEQQLDSVALKLQGLQ